MSLATRCITCNTVFRVAQDQLKASDGWVRCGRCNDVFNAVEGLFDLESDTEPQHLRDAAGRPVERAEEVKQRLAAMEASKVEENLPLSAKIDAQLQGSRDSKRLFNFGKISAPDQRDFPDAQFDSDILSNEMLDLPQDRSADTSAPKFLPPPRPKQPEFLKRAQQAARWRSPKMLTLQVASISFLSLVLLLQVINQFRNPIASRWPAFKPLMSAWCAVKGCRIEPPRRIEDVAVESSTLTRSATPDAFDLSVLIRNHASVPVMVPALDLSVTDSAGKLIARRMLRPSEVQAPSTSLAAGAEMALHFVFTTGAATVTGYTVELFYP